MSFDSQLFDSDVPMDAQRTLALYQRYYESHGPDLPAGKADDMRFVETLSNSLDGLEGLILDSYGVIGLGAAPIAGITNLFDEAARRGVPIVILTNGASQPAVNRVAGYRSWGLDVSAADIISSRDACHVMARDMAAANPDRRFAYLGRHVVPFDDIDGPIYGHDGASATGWGAADSYLFLGAIGWQEADQIALETALQSTGANLVVGNPDVSAPLSDGFSYEPGFWAMRAQEVTGCEVIMTGKPFAPAYEIAFAALQEKAGRRLTKSRVGMVGDSLHTDILGAKSFGLCAILLASYGLLSGRDIIQETQKAQIYPDIIATYL